MKTFLKFVIACVVAFIIANLICYAFNNSERAECTVWQEQATRYVGRYYITLWQLEQCQSYNIPINAPVVKPCEATESPTQCQTRVGDEWEVIYYPSTGHYQAEKI